MWTSIFNTTRNCECVKSQQSQNKWRITRVDSGYSYSYMTAVSTLLCDNITNRYDIQTKPYLCSTVKLTTSLTQSEANEQRTLHSVMVRWAQATRQHFTTKTAHQTDQFRLTALIQFTAAVQNKPLSSSLSLQCFDTVGWASGRASSL